MLETASACVHTSIRITVLTSDTGDTIIEGVVDPVHNVLSASQTIRRMATCQMKLEYSYCMPTHSL